MSNKYLIVDPYGQEVLVTESEEEVKAYLKHLINHEISIVDFIVTYNNEIIIKTILLS